MDRIHLRIAPDWRRHGASHHPALLVMIILGLALIGPVPTANAAPLSQAGVTKASPTSSQPQIATSGDDVRVTTNTNSAVVNANNTGHQAAQTGTTAVSS